MSRKKNHKEALRWLKTGKSDLEAAGILKENQKHAHACFNAQQAAEKAVKSVWYFFDADPWGHSILNLIEDMENVDINAFAVLNDFADDARKLDRFYIPTRYPNGLPGITPDMAYMEEDSSLSIAAAKKIIEVVESIIASETKNDA